MFLFKKLIGKLCQFNRFVLGISGAANAGKHIKYGQIKGGEVNIGGLAWAASQVVGNQSGKFFYMAAGAATLCLDNVAYIFGWALERARTPTVGDLFTGNVALDAVYRIPINSGTYVVGMIGDLCDISISTNVQGAQLDASVENLLIIVGGDLVDNDWVDVKINPAVQGAAVGCDA